MTVSRKRKEFRFSLLYILPSFVLIMVFSIIPIFMNVYYSFTEYNIIRDPVFTGLDNYVRMFNDSYVRAALKNTIIFTFVVVPVQTVVSLVFAALISQYARKRFGGFVKSALFVPVIASAVLIGNLWSMLLSPTGIINSVFEALGLSSVNFLGSRYLSLLSVCFVSIWKNVGYFLVIFYAGIMDIPDSLYEAAEVDGANKIQMFFNITVPSLKPVIYLVVTLGTIWSFQVFDLVYTMTGGGPGLSTQTLVLNIYNNAFKNSSMGYASAIALLMFVFVMLINFVQKKFLANEEK